MSKYRGKTAGGADLETWTADPNPGCQAREVELVKEGMHPAGTGTQMT